MNDMIEHRNRLLDMMRHAADLGARAPHTDRELAVGCVITDQALNIVASGYSRQDGQEKSHAEMIALANLPSGYDPAGLILFSTVEPCGTRLSQGPCCADLIIESGIKNVLYAMHEPAHFVHQNGIGRMRKHGITTEHLCDDSVFQAVARANPHIAWTA